jgi:hypothetical protein
MHDWLALETPLGQRASPCKHQFVIGAVLGMAEPQQLLGVLEELPDCPTFFVRPDESCGCELRGIGHQPEDLGLVPFAREDDRERTEGAHLEPPGINKAVAGVAVERRDHVGLGTTSPEQVPPIAAGLEFPIAFEEAAIALERAGKVEALLTTGLDHSGAEIIGIKQYGSVLI